MQKQDVPRETFIALRARRQAFKIAHDFLYRDPAPDSAVPTLEYGRDGRTRFRLPKLDAGAIVLFALIVLCVVAFLVIEGTIGLSQPVKLK